MNIKDLSYDEIIKLVISNSISLEQLEELSNEDNNYIKCAVAYNCTLKILEKFCDDEEYTVRARIPLNNNCTLSILEKLSDDNNSIVRKRVIYNNNCSVSLLEKLYKEFPDEVLEHPNCPEYLKILSK